MNRYCTYFDHRFIDRGLAMIRSLRRVDPDCRITVLSLTEACWKTLERLGEPGLRIIHLDDFERMQPDLSAIREQRSWRDYCFALSSCIAAWEIVSAAPGEIVTYVDADLLFYSSPAPLFALMANASVGLVTHRHHWWSRRLEKYGRSNVGWVSFRADDVGRRACIWWRSRCIEWCYGFLEGDRFADQKYLDWMPGLFPRVVELTHPGANVGPWNICRHRVARSSGGDYVVDGRYPLIFFHYSGIRETEPGLFHCSNISYLAPLVPRVRDSLYRPYLSLLLDIRRELGGLPQQDTPDLWGSLPGLRARYAAAFRWAGLLMGHYLRVAAPA